MKVLVVGNGGREHALAWKIAQSARVQGVVIAPGNAGTARVGRNVPVAADDLDGLVRLAGDEGVELVVIGPEDPLCNGLADKLRERGLAVFGPGAAGARLEGSKVHAKEFLQRYRIPCAAGRRFDRSGAAKSYLESQSTWPQVVKADGLAAGKGVFVVDDARAGCAVIDQVMEERSLGAAGSQIIIEEHLAGEEISILAMTDGEALLILDPVVDHKQVGEGDTGPNTGGMGVYSPAAVLNRRQMRQIEQHILVPTLHGLRREEVEYRGCLFVGLMLTESGPRVLEYNCRFGDPEVQAVVRRLQGDLVPYLEATAKGELAKLEAPAYDARTCVGVVAAAEGYPGEVRKGDLIDGLDDAEKDDDIVVFHAGTQERTGGVATSGGRVLCVTALGEGVEVAREKAYGAYDRIRWQGKFCRRDIGLRRPGHAAPGRTAAGSRPL